MGPGTGGADRAPALPQLGHANVTATATTYQFGGAGVAITLTFRSSGMRAGNLTSSSRPITYITWSVRSLDAGGGGTKPGNSGGGHRVQLYFDAGAEHCTSSNRENVSWGRAAPPAPPATAALAAAASVHAASPSPPSASASGAFEAMRIGASVQKVLHVAPDISKHINWGYMYVAWRSSSAANATSVLSGAAATRRGFCATGALPTRDDTRMPRPVDDDGIVAAVVFDCGTVGTTELGAETQPGGTGAGAGSCERSVVFAYDDVKSVEYDHRQLEPYWRHRYRERYPAPPPGAGVSPKDDPTFIGMLGEAVQDEAAETELARARQFRHHFGPFLTGCSTL